MFFTLFQELEWGLLGPGSSDPCAIPHLELLRFAVVDDQPFLSHGKLFIHEVESRPVIWQCISLQIPCKKTGDPRRRLTRRRFTDAADGGLDTSQRAGVLCLGLLGGF